MDEQIIAPGYYDLAFYSAAWFIAAFCGLLSTYLDRHSRDICELLAVGSVSGWISVGCVGGIVRVAGGTYGNEPYYFFIAIMVGLLGKKGLYLVTWIVNAGLKKYGIPIDASEKNSCPIDPDDKRTSDGDSAG